MARRGIERPTIATWIVIVIGAAILAPSIARATDGDERCAPEVPVEPDRRAPTVDVPPYEQTPCDPQALPPPRPQTSPDVASLPDRWRIVSLLGTAENLLDPYHGNNWLKGDRPAFGEDWFVNLSAVSDTVVEPRRFATPVGVPVTDRPGSLDLIGDGGQLFFIENLALEGVLYKGDTVFKPPEYEFRFTPVLSYSVTDSEERGVLKANPTAPTTRREGVVGIQALFVDKHLRNVSSRYDFDSIRVGIQPFSADFRGFLFQDGALGVRWFGNRHNNRVQWNLAWFRRLEKDTTSGLNNVLELGADAIRKDDVLIANVFLQDYPTPGFTSELVLAHNRNREGGEQTYDDHGVLQRPAAIGLERGRDYRVTYLGLNGDGHFGRTNLTASAYAVFGSESRGLFVERGDNVRAFFGAAEVSRDFDWMRARLSFLYASGDRNSYDTQATGYDAIFENPLFAGADTSFWIRQPVPLIGGGRVALSGRNGILNSLRSSKDFGQSNFTNPGLVLIGGGVDLDLTPALRTAVNVNQLWFVDTSSVEAARNQGSIGRDIGLDLSAAVTYRPLATQNIVLRLSAAVLVPGSGYRSLFGDKTQYSILANVVLTY
jgi:hypothetical protein